MMTMVDYDLIVIGGGAAGLGTARASRRAGARTLLVSDGEPGGDCTFYGCVPSKTLIESARQGLPYTAAAQRVRDVVAQIAATEDAAALRGEGIDVLLGRARFTAPGRIQVDGRSLTARRFVVATGSAPSIPPIRGLDTVPYLTNETVFALPARPVSLAVLGGGAVGCELAQAFARLGSQVTLIEGLDRLLPREDPEASHVIEAVFRRDGIGVHTGARVEAVSAADGGMRISLAGAAGVTAQHLLVAVGRRPVTDSLDLEHIGVRVDERGQVITDEHLATQAPGVYAAGDVTGRLQFTHAAFHMGRVAAANALARRPWQGRRYRPDATPWVTFTDPELARVGMTEADAATRGGRVAYLPMAEMDRALAAAATDGFIKLIAGPRPLLRNAGGGRILGATVVAARAGEMIHEPALAMATGMFTGRLAAATHAYPTWSYGMQLAAAQFFMTVGGRTARPARPHR
jgi:pyruvate/2-oxoglutarate dehydrogenase complex dihydrolipoamide dehydrogenase (E3) component